MLGSDYRIVEVGFDTSLAGALNQWHRDFPMTVQTGLVMGEPECGGRPTSARDSVLA